MLRRLAPGAAAALLALSPLAAARQTIDLDVAPTTALAWVGQSTAGALVSNDQEASVRGRLRVQLGASPAGPVAALTGLLRLEPVAGAVQGPAGGVLARAAFSDVALRLVAAPGAVVPTPGGALELDLDVRAGFQSGTLRLDPPTGPSSSVDLAGTPADRFRLVGRLVRDGGTWRLAAPLRLELRFEGPTGFAGGFRLRGLLRADEPCAPARPFCAQGPGAPRLAPLQPAATGGAPILRFAVEAGAAGQNVALFGGTRQAPAPAAVGGLCLGAPRRLLAMGATGPAGGAVLEWQPGPAGVAALASGDFAVQALVAAQPARLTNALALQRCD